MTMLTALLEVPEADLLNLARAFRCDKLKPPVTLFSLQTFLTGRASSAMADELQSLLDQGMKAEHLAVCLELVATDRERRASKPIDLVTTGPEAPGVVNRDTAAVVHQLFHEAASEVIVAGYAVYQGRDVFQELAHRMELIPSLRVRMFLDVQRAPGDDSVDSEVVSRFAYRFRTFEWPGIRMPEVFFYPASLAQNAGVRACLHAKCVVVDRQQAFISSANFTEAAQQRNIEVGVLIRSSEIACQLAEHFESLSRKGDLQPVPGV